MRTGEKANTTASPMPASGPAHEPLCLQPKQGKLLAEPANRRVVRARLDEGVSEEIARERA